jgi:hypothetical protein
MMRAIKWGKLTRQAVDDTPRHPGSPDKLPHDWSKIEGIQL